MTAIDDDIIHEIQLEGGDKLTNNPADRGGRTQFGISERANPQAWADNKVTEDEARAIFFTKYVTTPGFDKITDPHLQAQLIDFGVVSGPFVAISKLQEIVGGLKIDGVLGPITLARTNVADVRKTNNSLVCARVNMICKLVGNDPTQLTFLRGWVNRSLTFLC